MNQLQTYAHTTNSALQHIESIQDNYTFHVRQFTRWIRNGDREIEPGSIHDYFKSLNESTYAANTIRIKRQAVKKRLKSMLRDVDIETRIKMEQYLKDLDNESDTRAPTINDPSIKRDKYLTEDQYQTLLMKCRSRKQMLFIRFLMTTACRVSEMTGIKIGHCKRVENKVYITIKGKRNKYRDLIVAEELYNQIQECFGGEEYLFETDGGKEYSRSYVSAQIKKIGKLINRNISAHTLRHSRITMLVARYPGSLHAISRYVGHSNLAITLEMYCHGEMSDEMLFDLEVA